MGKEMQAPGHLPRLGSATAFSGWPLPGHRPGGRLLGNNLRGCLRGLENWNHLGPPPATAEGRGVGTQGWPWHLWVHGARGPIFSRRRSQRPPQRCIPGNPDLGFSMKIALTPPEKPEGGNGRWHKFPRTLGSLADR